MTSDEVGEATAGSLATWLRRGWPLLLLVLLSALVLLSGWYRELTFENLARHYGELNVTIAGHRFLALAAYLALYIAAITLSIPIGAFLTVAGGILFGGAVGGAVASVGATIGAICLFLVAQSAFGALLLKRAGPLGAALAGGFRADAFNYLLFLRLVPVFPFWLVNLVPALCDVPLLTFAAATAIGIVPATFAFAYIGATLGGVVTAQSEAYRACLAGGGNDCHLEFHPHAMLTHGVWAALLALGVLALLPVAVRRWRGRSGRQT